MRLAHLFTWRIHDLFQVPKQRPGTQDLDVDKCLVPNFASMIAEGHLC